MNENVSHVSKMPFAFFFLFLLFFPVLIFQYAEQHLSDESSILFGNFQLWLVSFTPCAPCLFSFFTVLYSFLPSFCLGVCFLFHISHRMSQPSPLPHLKLHRATWLLFGNDPEEPGCSQMIREERWLRSLGELLLQVALWRRREMLVCHLLRLPYVWAALRKQGQIHQTRQSAAKVGAITCHHSDFRFPSGYSGRSVTLIHLRSALGEERRVWEGLTSNLIILFQVL